MPLWLRFTIVFLVFGTLSSLLHRYVWARLVRDAELGPPWARIATWAIVALAILLPATMFIARALPRAAARPIAFVGFTWLGVLFLLFTFLFAGDVVRLLVRVAPLQMDAERRLLLGRSIAAFAAIGASGVSAWGVIDMARKVAIKPIRVALKRLPKEMDGLVIAQLTDVHVGSTIGRGFIEDVVARTNAVEPDVIVITGDLVDGPVANLREHVAPLAGLRAPLGVYFVTGNHEYYSGVDEWLDELGRLGIRVLRNERVTLTKNGASIDLAGVDDFSSGAFPGHGPNLPRALEGRDPTRELVLLAHQPKAIVEGEKLGVGLQLSGHTHGGQIWPWKYAVFLQQPYVDGLHRRGESQIYVSCGTGYWGPPMRVGASAEISKLTLVRA